MLRRDSISGTVSNNIIPNLLVWECDGELADSVVTVTNVQHPTSAPTPKNGDPELRGMPGVSFGVSTCFAGLISNELRERARVPWRGA